ncbi:MAG: WGR domain-containing protein [Silvanigrellaceae bacterium]|nr:WGR domain-containing protein [Silvanigrellaceae bacterium]
MHLWLTALPFVLFLDFRKKDAYHAARFEKESRYYALRLEKDLLNDWTITVINGRIKSRLGQSRILAFDSYDIAFEYFYDMTKTRYQRHYFLKNIICDDAMLLYLLFLMINFDKPKAIQAIHKIRSYSEKPLQVAAQQMSLIF